MLFSFFQASRMQNYCQLYQLPQADSEEEQQQQNEALLDLGDVLLVEKKRWALSDVGLRSDGPQAHASTPKIGASVPMRNFIKIRANCSNEKNLNFAISPRSTILSQSARVSQKVTQYT